MTEVANAALARGTPEEHGLTFCVAMPTRGRPALAIRALEAVVPQLVEGDELVVVDNGSPAEDVRRVEAWLDAHGGQGRLVVEERAGVSAARNRALEETAARVVCFIDDDVRVAPDWLGALRNAWADAGPSTAAIGGPMRPDWQAPRPSWLPDRALFVLSVLDLGPVRRRLDQQPGSGYLWGGNISLRRDAAQAVGGFRSDTIYLERVRPNVSSQVLTTARSGEEEDVQTRLAAAGWEVWYEPGAAVDHAIPPERVSEAFFRDFYRQLGYQQAMRGRSRAAGAALIGWAALRYVVCRVLRRPDARFSTFLAVQGWALVRRLPRTRPPQTAGRA